MAALPYFSEPEVAKSEGKGPSGTHSVPAVEKLFSILQVLATSHAGMTIRDLAKSCDLPKSSVHGIIVTLERRGYLHRSERTGQYVFERKLLALGNCALRGTELRDRIEPHMRLLSRRADLPVYAGILDLDEAVVIARVDSFLKARQPRWSIGKRRPVHCCAMGKALIAHWNDARIERLVEHRGLMRHNENTISSLRRLKNDLATVRREGFAVDDEEDVLGFRGVGAPLLDADGKVCGAICVSGTTSEITGDNLSTLGALVTEASAAFARTRPVVMSASSQTRERALAAAV